MTDSRALIERARASLKSRGIEGGWEQIFKWAERGASLEGATEAWANLYLDDDLPGEGDIYPDREKAERESASIGGEVRRVLILPEEVKP